MFTKTCLTLSRKFMSFKSTMNLLKIPLQIENVRGVATRKRFYKNTGILRSNKHFEVILDQRKLKTPKGNLFVVDNEPLALAVAAEWDAQKEKIVQTDMHLTTLCNSVIDNPNNLTKFEIAQYITDYLDTDTVLYHSNEDDELYKFQENEWDPIIQWFCDRFQIDMQKSRDIGGPTISEKSKSVISRYILSYNLAACMGLMYAIDTLKSPILAIACTERFITPEKAVYLSRLEEEYQLTFWGRVEWAHDLSQNDLQARVAATILFIYFNTTSSYTQSKKLEEITQ